MITRVVQAVRPPKWKARVLAKIIFSSLSLSRLFRRFRPPFDFFGLHMDMYGCEWVVSLG